VEYFTKWIEAKPLTNVSSASIKKFFWQNIICRYSVPRHITVDNTKYFDSAMFKEFCHKIGTKVAFTSVYHPQSNGVVERANPIIFEAMKKILEGEKKRKWAEIMPTTVWSHNTIVCRAMNFTCFRLMYDTEAMLPVEIKHWSLRMATETVPCPNEAEEKGFLESDRLKVVVFLEKIPGAHKSMERPKGQTTRIRSGKSGTSAEPQDLEHQKVWTLVDRTIRGNIEDMARCIPLIKNW
jgi:hypothetical protein